MRDIKFRAWDTESKIMRYDDYCLRFTTALVTGKYGEEFPEMKPLLYTGIKDKNGKEIYEGDVVKAYNSSLEIIEERPVTFEYGTFTIGRYWKDGQHDWCSMEQYDSFELEVIGNVYE